MNIKEGMNNLILMCMPNISPLHSINNSQKRGMSLSHQTNNMIFHKDLIMDSTNMIHFKAPVALIKIDLYLRNKRNRKRKTLIGSRKKEKKVLEMISISISVVHNKAAPSHLRLKIKLQILMIF